VQSVELYKGAYITYSIGNFVFDQMWSTETREGSLQRLSFVGPRLMAVRIMPTLIEDYFQPRLLGVTEPQYRQTLERIWAHSTLTPSASR
jgi:poly-gamma-glutamate synthesis protein (capsule biosynthesis protein)